MTEIFENKYFRFIISTFFVFVFIFTRSFMGVYIFGFRIGEIAIFISLLILLLFSLIFRKNSSLTLFENQKINKTLILILFTFLINTYFSESKLTDPYTYKASSYIWVFGFFYLGYLTTINFKFQKRIFNLSLFILIYIYFVAINDLPIKFQQFVLTISDKYEPHKGSDILIMFIAIMFIFTRINTKRIGIEVLCVFSFLFFPLLLYKSRGAFISLVLYFLLEVIYNRKILLNSTFFRNISLIFVSTFVLLQSVFFVTQSGTLKVSIANEKINQVAQYRAPEIKPGEYVNYLYRKDGRFYSTDVNINWRIQIWQDVFDDTQKDNTFLLGNGYSEKIPAMAALDFEGNSVRSGLDGMNENVHNFLINIYARGGIIHLFLFLALFFFMIKESKYQNGSFSVLIFLLPVLFCSFFDASMENSHFPLILYFLLGLNLNGKTVFDKI